MKTTLAVVCSRAESLPTWTADNLGAVKSAHSVGKTFLL